MAGEDKFNKRTGGQSIDERYDKWKYLVPVLYDWFTNHNLVWPSLSCRWGPQLDSAEHKSSHRLYLSEQTDGIYPNTLVIAKVDVSKPRVAAAEQISEFNEEEPSPFVKRQKTIIHPGEVNRIRELPTKKHIIATHTDSPDVFIWDLEAQPTRRPVIGASHSHPDLVLTGHEENAEFALAMSHSEPFVLSGGKDRTVVLWSLQDHISSLSDGSSIKSPGRIGDEKNANNPKIGPRNVFRGHQDTVEDVQFSPFCSQEFCSVGDDSCLIFWDARVGTTPAITMGNVGMGIVSLSFAGLNQLINRDAEWEVQGYIPNVRLDPFELPEVDKAHNTDLHCVDWSPHVENHIITGSADTTVRLFDRRKLTSGNVGTPLHIFEWHDAAVLCVQWCPDKASVFGSAAEDGYLNIWDHEKVGKSGQQMGAMASTAPPELFFQHSGHRDKIVDFNWNSEDPWTIVSVSDDGESTGGGGTLQAWRMSDLIYRPQDEVLEELNKYKDQLLTSSDNVVSL